ncbi:hypothetical protein [Sphingomonas sp.]|uniref:hypothetical protein n=1 Tax=Sphingomonas sp. TaxID=28214 RepID=UPI0028AFB9CE|nr:hypothetical protein [Sphingomonas sp.]
MTAEQEAEIIERSRRLTDAAERGGHRPIDDHEGVEHMIIQRFISKQRGGWRMFSAETEANSDAERARERSHSQQSAADGDDVKV